MLLHFVGWLIFSCVFMSLVEHYVHSTLMHKRTFFSARLKTFKRMLESHAVLHHGQYRTIFSDEPLPPGEDKGIRLNIIEGLLEMSPFILLFGLISPIGGATFACIVVVHHFMWNQTHLEMHKPEDRIFSNWPAFKWMCRHHALHHLHPSKNFNVVFPIGDLLFNTFAKSSYRDHAEMYRMGLYPRGPKPSSVVAAAAAKVKDDQPNSNTVAAATAASAEKQTAVGSRG